MQDIAGYPLGRLDGADVAVQSTAGGQAIVIQQSDIGQALASLLSFGKAAVIRHGDATYWRIVHDQQVDDRLVELIDLLISIRYSHPALVQLELVLEPNEP